MTIHKVIKHLINGVGLLNSHLTTLHHWLSLRGKSRWPLIHLEKYGYMTVSLVGRIAIGISSSDSPDFVTHATWKKNLVSYKDNISSQQDQHATLLKLFQLSAIVYSTTNHESLTESDCIIKSRANMANAKTRKLIYTIQGTHTQTKWKHIKNMRNAQGRQENKNFKFQSYCECIYEQKRIRNISLQVKILRKFGQSKIGWYNKTARN